MLAWVGRSEPLADWSFSPPFYGLYPLLVSLQWSFYFFFSTANLNKPSLEFSTLIIWHFLCSCFFSELSTLQIIFLVVTSHMLSYWFSFIFAVFMTSSIRWKRLILDHLYLLNLEWVCFQTLYSFFSCGKLQIFLSIWIQHGHPIVFWHTVISSFNSWESTFISTFTCLCFSHLSYTAAKIR